MTARDPLDRYYTPDALARACLAALLADEGLPPGTLLEPCAGGGAFGRAALRAGVSLVRGCDVDPAADPGFPCARLPVSDWAPHVAPAPPGPVWIVTNPHYRGVYDTVAEMRGLQARVGASVLALLLRATTIEQLMPGADPPAALWVSNLRPRWGGPGGEALRSGDTCGSVLAVWRPAGAVRGPTTIHALPAWRAKGRAAAVGAP
jgi:hypothetical protein